MKPANTFTLVHHGDLLLAVVPQGTDWKAEVLAECNRAGITMLGTDEFEEYKAAEDYDPGVFSIDSLRITTNQVLTDYYPDDRAGIYHEGGIESGGEIVDPDGREWRFARNLS
jgi:hypothetical protein